MKHILYKVSSPGWDKEFSSEYDARQELLRYVCRACLAGSIEYVGEDGQIVMDEDGDPPPDQSCIQELLSTACGCEFDYEGA